MSKRFLNFFLCVFSLVLGCAFYVFFRVDSHIAKAFDEIPWVLLLRKRLWWRSSKFLKFYFLDFLWGFALSCGLLGIFDFRFNLKGKIACCTTAFALGVLWEILQSVHAVNGTGDFLDMIMYLAASVTALILNAKENNDGKI